MTLEVLLESIAVYGPISIIRDDNLALGALPLVWYDCGAAVEECDPMLMQLDVLGINATDGELTNGMPTLEIALDFSSDKAEKVAKELGW